WRERTTGAGDRTLHAGTPAPASLEVSRRRRSDRLGAGAGPAASIAPRRRDRGRNARLLPEGSPRRRRSRRCGDRRPGVGGGNRGVAVDARDDLVVHLARFAGVLRARRIEVAVGDEVDAVRALTLVDLLDRAEVQRALQIALKIRSADRAAFDALFRSFWTLPQLDRRQEPAQRRAAGGARPRGGTNAEPDGLAGDDRRRPSDGSTPGYTRDIVLRRKPFEECSERDLAEMERLLERLVPRWAARRSRPPEPVPR